MKTHAPKTTLYGGGLHTPQTHACAPTLPSASRTAAPEASTSPTSLLCHRLVFQQPVLAAQAFNADTHSIRGSKQPLFNWRYVLELAHASTISMHQSLRVGGEGGEVGSATRRKPCVAMRGPAVPTHPRHTAGPVLAAFRGINYLTHTLQRKTYQPALLSSHRWACTASTCEPLDTRSASYLPAQLSHRRLSTWPFRASQ